MGDIIVGMLKGWNVATFFLAKPTKQYSTLKSSTFQLFNITTFQHSPYNRVNDIYMAFVTLI